MVKVNLKEILYIEGLDDYIKIYLPGKAILTLMTLKTIAQKLPARDSYRAIVPISSPSVRSNISAEVKLKLLKKEIPIGVSYSEKLLCRHGKIN